MPVSAAVDGIRDWRYLSKAGVGPKTSVLQEKQVMMDSNSKRNSNLGTKDDDASIG